MFYSCFTLTGTDKQRHWSSWVWMGCINEVWLSPWLTVKVEFDLNPDHRIVLYHSLSYLSIYLSMLSQHYHLEKCKISQIVWSTCMYSCGVWNIGHFEHNLACKIGFHGWSVPAAQHLLCGVEHTVISAPCSSIHFVKLSAWPALHCFQSVRYITSGLHFCILCAKL